MKVEDKLKNVEIGFDDKDSQIKVKLFTTGRPEVYDMVRLELTSIEGEKQILDMTPDEALEISANLNMAVGFYLLESDKYCKLKFEGLKERTKK